MTSGEPDTAAITRHILRAAADPTAAELETIKRGVSAGMEASAETLEFAASDQTILDILARDPSRGLMRIAESLRKAVPR